MKLFFRCGLGLWMALLAACSHFDNHDQTLPREITEALEVISNESAEVREKRSGDLTEIHVGKILIINRTVLNEYDLLAPVLNNIHWVTQKDVIFDELHFKEGDRIPRYRLYDAERYIRLLGSIKQARIIEHKHPETGVTDLTVVTRDRYSPKFNTGANGSGGYASFGLRVTEPSLFGRLYTLAGSYNRENFRDFVTASTGKARINGSRWEVLGETTMGFANSQFNYQGYGFRLTHPFLRNGQRHGFNLAGVFVNGVNYDYAGGGIRKGTDSESGRSFDLVYRTKYEYVLAQYLYGIGTNDRIEFGPGLLHWVRQDYYINPADQYTLAATPAVAVSDRTKAFYQPQQYSTNAVMVAVNTRNGHFVPMKNFQRYLFTEDQFEGLRTATTIIHANPSLGLLDFYTTTLFSVSYQNNTRNQVFRVESQVDRVATFWHSGSPHPTDDLWAGDLRAFYFTRFGTLAVRGYVVQGFHLTQNLRSGSNLQSGLASQANITGQGGLYGPNAVASQFTRGFSYGSVYPSAGNLTSLEYRSPGLKLPYLLIAGVLFFDYAGVGDSLSTLTYFPVAGFGLRSMWHEFDNNVFRIDFGFKLNEGEIRLMNALQFGLSHAF